MKIKMDRSKKCLSREDMKELTVATAGAAAMPERPEKAGKAAGATA